MWPEKISLTSEEDDLDNITAQIMNKVLLLNSGRNAKYAALLKMLKAKMWGSNFC